MLGFIVDALFVLVAGGATWLVARHGAVRAGMCLVAVLISSVFALTSFEAFSRWIKRVYLLGPSGALQDYVHFPALLFLFSISLVLLLFFGRKALPEPPQFDERTETVAQWGLGFAAGYLLAAFLLTAIHTAAAPRNFWGALEPQADLRDGPIARLAPDYQMLGIVEFSAGRAFALDDGAWTLGLPWIEVSGQGDRWASFIPRYAVWRELREFSWAIDDPDETQNENDAE